jgi:probable blue pigment (indigoidine) exporter
VTSAHLRSAIAVTAVWGLCFVLIQAQLPSPAPLLLAAVRALLGASALGAWAWFRRAHRRGDIAGAPTLPSLGRLVAMSVLNISVAFGAMYLAAGRSEAAIAGVLTGAQPLMLALAGWLLLAERPARRTVAGLLIALVGLVVATSSASGETTIDGVLLALLAALAPAIGTLLVRGAAAGIDIERTTVGQLLIGGLLLLGVSLVTEPWGSIGWGPAPVVAILVLGVAGTGIAYAVWFRLARVVPLTSLGPVLFVVPVVGLLAGIAVGNRPGPLELTGIAALLVGIVLSTSGAPRHVSP